MTQSRDRKGAAANAAPLPVGHGSDEPDETTAEPRPKGSGPLMYGEE
jgi:hypothetical protein